MADVRGRIEHILLILLRYRHVCSGKCIVSSRCSACIYVGGCSKLVGVNIIVIIAVVASITVYRGVIRSSSDITVVAVVAVVMHDRRRGCVITSRGIIVATGITSILIIRIYILLLM